MRNKLLLIVIVLRTCNTHFGSAIEKSILSHNVCVLSLEIGKDSHMERAVYVVPLFLQGYVLCNVMHIKILVVPQAAFHAYFLIPLSTPNSLHTEDIFTCSCFSTSLIFDGKKC